MAADLKVPCGYCLGLETKTDYHDEEGNFTHTATDTREQQKVVHDMLVAGGHHA